MGPLLVHCKILLIKLDGDHNTSCKEPISKQAIYLPELDLVLHNIFFSDLHFFSISWSHINRDGNFVAHHIAKLILFGIGEPRSSKSGSLYFDEQFMFEVILALFSLKNI